MCSDSVDYISLIILHCTSVFPPQLVLVWYSQFGPKEKKQDSLIRIMILINYIICHYFIDVFVICILTNLYNFYNSTCLSISFHREPVN